MIDDDQDKIGSFIHGIKVVGNRNFITEAANIYNIDQIILALPSVSRKTIKEIILICKETNCRTEAINTTRSNCLYFRINSCWIS